MPPRASLITNNADHPRKTRVQLQIQKQEITVQTTHQQDDSQSITPMQTVHKIITSQDQIIHEYPDVFERIAKFPWQPYHIQADPSVTPKQTPCRTIPIHLKEAFQKEINKMLQAGVLVLITEATPWINSFILVESNDKQGQLKLRICLDPTNLNKVVTREPYHFCMPEGISHLLADACILTLCDCQKGYWHQRLDEVSYYLTTFNTEMGRYRFTVMPFGIMVAGDMFPTQIGWMSRSHTEFDCDCRWHHGNWKKAELYGPWSSIHHTATNCMKVQYQAHLWKTPIQVHSSKFLWRNLHKQMAANQPRVKSLQ